MKVFPDNEDPSNRPGCREEENDPVWRLLGESPRPEPDAWMAARTLARCRAAGGTASSWLGVWRWALGGGMGLCLAMVLLMTQVQHPVAVRTTDNQQEVQKAFEIVASLDAPDSDFSSTSS